MKAKIVRLGTPYFAGQPLFVDKPVYEEIPSIGDSILGKELSWVQDGSLLVATQCLCYGVSWEQLHEKGFIFGQPVQIDGKAYLCRSLKAGATKDEPNEWDDLLNKFGRDNHLWNWKKIYFWGQETVIHSNLEYKVVRGSEISRTWTYFNPKRDYVDVGFRPVLEPFSPVPSLTEAALGCRIKLYGPRGEMLTGILAGFDDYDVVLEELSFQPQPNAEGVPCDWLTMNAENAVVNRKAISLIQRI